MESFNDVGQVLAHMQSLYGISRDTLTPLNVDAGIMSWLVSDEGRPIFERRLEDLAHEYRQTFQRVRLVPGNANAVEVNLDAVPQSNYRFGRVKRIRGGRRGWVRLERRGKHLYFGTDAGSEMVSLFAHRLQRGRSNVSGMELEALLKHWTMLHPNVLDALLERPHLIPKNWEHNRKRQIQYIVFWDVVFEDTESGNEYVRTLYKDSEGWKSGSLALHYVFDALHPAAALLGHC